MITIAKNIFKHILRRIPIGISLGIFVFIFLTLYEKLNDYSFYQILSSARTDIITISGILAGIIIAYLSSKVLQIRNEKIAHLPELKDLTQKVHKFRGIVNKLIHSDLWVPGLITFIDKNLFTTANL